MPRQVKSLPNIMVIEAQEKTLISAEFKMMDVASVTNCRIIDSTRDTDFILILNDEELTGLFS